MKSPNLKSRKYQHELLQDIDSCKIYDTNNIEFSILLSIINANFQHGEKLFIDIFRGALIHVTDPKLLEQIRLFIYQEANHSKMYQFFCEDLWHHGDVYSKRMLDDCRNYHSSSSKQIRNKKSLKDKIFYVIIAEMFASRFSEYFLENYKHRFQLHDPKLTYLYALHSIEEIEHQSLAFDLYTSLFNETPQSDINNIMEFKKYSDKTVKIFCKYTVLQTKLWRINNGLAPLKRSDIFANIIGPGKLFPNGEICPQFKNKDFHPYNPYYQSMIATWDKEWEPMLLDLISG